MQCGGKADVASTRLCFSEATVIYKEVAPAALPKSEMRAQKIQFSESAQAKSLRLLIPQPSAGQITASFCQPACSQPPSSLLSIMQTSIVNAAYTCGRLSQIAPPAH